MTEYDSIDTDFGTEQTERVTRIALEQLAAERRLSEQNRALKEVQRLQRNGLPVPKPLLQQAIGRIEFKSAGARREK